MAETTESSAFFEVQALNRKLRAEIERLKADTALLPKDAEGNPMGPGCRRWVCLDDENPEATEVAVSTREWSGPDDLYVFVHVEGRGGDLDFILLADLYPTCAAAEAAKEQP